MGGFDRVPIVFHVSQSISLLDPECGRKTLLNDNDPHTHPI